MIVTSIINTILTTITQTPNTNTQKKLQSNLAVQCYKLLTTFQSSSHERASRLQVSAAPETEVPGKEGEQVRLLDIATDIAWRQPDQSSTRSSATIDASDASSIDVTRGPEDSALFSTVCLSAVSLTAQAERRLQRR